MPGWNTTVQDYSPLISYSPLGAWSAEYNSTGSFYEFYNDKYTSTSTINATASFECNGTGIWIYGAKGPNHGAYTVTLDGMVNTLNATSTEWLQTLLFAAPALGAGRHVVEVSNTGGAMVSVDLVECQHSTAEDENLIQQMFVDVGSRPWVYEGDWMMNSDASSTSTSGIQTSGSNASATLQFRGTHVDVYGHTSPTCGSFLVSLDDVTDPRTFNCTSSITHAQVLLYSADMVGGRNHSLKLTNLAQSDRSTLYLENAVVISSRDGSREDLGPSRAPLSSGTRIGIIIALSVAIPLLGAICIVICLRRRHHRLGQRRRSMKEVLPDRSKRLTLDLEQSNVKMGLQNHRPMVYLAIPSPSPSATSPLSPISPQQQVESQYRSAIIRTNSSASRMVVPSGTLTPALNGPAHPRGGGSGVPWLLIPEARQRVPLDSPLTPLAPSTRIHHPFALARHPPSPPPIAIVPLPPPSVLGGHPPGPRRSVLRIRDEKRWRVDRRSHPPPPNYWQATAQPL